MIKVIVDMMHIPSGRVSRHVCNPAEKMVANATSVLTLKSKAIFSKKGCSLLESPELRCFLQQYSLAEEVYYSDRAQSSQVP